MKNLASIITLAVILFSGVFVESASANPKKPAGKHKSHKKTKVSKSGYYYNFQH